MCEMTARLVHAYLHVWLLIPKRLACCVATWLKRHDMQEMKWTLDEPVCCTKLRLLPHTHFKTEETCRCPHPGWISIATRCWCLFVFEDPTSRTDIHRNRTSKPSVVHHPVNLYDLRWYLWFYHGEVRDGSLVKYRQNPPTSLRIHDFETPIAVAIYESNISHSACTVVLNHEKLASTIRMADLRYY